MKHDSVMLWSTEEDQVLLQMYHTKGTKWRKMASHLPGRSEASIRNRFQRLVHNRSRYGTNTAPRNRCSKCNEFRLGHSCGMKQSDLETAKDLATHRKQVVWDENLTYDTTLDTNTATTKPKSTPPSILKTHFRFEPPEYQSVRLHMDGYEGPNYLLSSADATTTANTFTEYYDMKLPQYYNCIPRVAIPSSPVASTTLKSSKSHTSNGSNGSNDTARQITPTKSSINTASKRDRSRFESEHTKNIDNNATFVNTMEATPINFEEQNLKCYQRIQAWFQKYGNYLEKRTASSLWLDFVDRGAFDFNDPYDQTVKNPVVTVRDVEYFLSMQDDCHVIDLCDQVDFAATLCSIDS